MDPPAARRRGAHHGLGVGCRARPIRASSVSRSVGDSPSADSLSATATSSSAKNGLPSERAKTAAKQLPGGGAPRIAGICSRISVSVSGRQLQPLGCGRGGDVGQEASQTGAPADLVAAIGRDDQRCARGAGAGQGRPAGRGSSDRPSGDPRARAAPARTPRRARAGPARAHGGAPTGSAASRALAGPADAGRPRLRRRVRRRRQVAQRVGHRQQRDRRLLELAHCPRSTHAPSSAARAASSATSLLLPIPASPPTSTTIGTPSAASSMAATSSPELTCTPGEDPARQPLRHGASIAP